MAAKKKSAKKKTARKSSRKSPVTELLEKQHRKVEALFKKLEGGRSPKGPVLEELTNSLAAHMVIEQEIYYPAVKELKSDLVMEAYEEHSVAELGLKRLLATDPEDEAFDARVTTCKELIEHHVEEEEEELFKTVDGQMEDEELAALAKRMKARFAEVMALGFAAAVPRGPAGKTSADVTRR
ncbi:MAG: hypothetical protein JWP97_2888 [Labilithrix sp.]|nr:hypothetical protein [Labilithrix sp.]